MMGELVKKDYTRCCMVLLCKIVYVQQVAVKCSISAVELQTNGVYYMSLYMVSRAEFFKNITTDEESLCILIVLPIPKVCKELQYL